MIQKDTVNLELFSFELLTGGHTHINRVQSSLKLAVIASQCDSFTIKKLNYEIFTCIIYVHTHDKHSN